MQECRRCWEETLTLFAQLKIIHLFVKYAKFLRLKQMEVFTTLFKQSINYHMLAIFTDQVDSNFIFKPTILQNDNDVIEK